jgi:hypothetical protein
MNTGSEQVRVAVDEVVFDQLEEDDSIKLETATGSIYNLQVVSTDGGRRTVTINRDSQHPAKMGNTPVEVDDSLLFTMLGSCHGSISSLDGDELSPLNSTEGRFVVGEQAWLASENGEPLITSAVAKLAITKS